MRQLNHLCSTVLIAFLLLSAPALAADPPKVQRLSESGPPPDKVMIGQAEWIAVPITKSVFRARIDTGATTTSIFATEIEIFERDGDKWVRFVIQNTDPEEEFPMEAPVARIVPIKKRGVEGHTQRPAVKMDLVMGETTKKVEVNLADRTGFEYPLLIGRDFLGGLAIVDVTLEYTQKTPGSPEDPKSEDD